MNCQISKVSIEMNILFADDHAMVRDGIGLLLKQLDEQCTLYDCINFHDVKNALNLMSFDLVIVDLIMPGMLGMQGVRYIRRSIPATPLVILSSSEEPSIVKQSLKCGVNGYITKSLCGSAFLHALKVVLEGDVYLPPEYSHLTSSIDSKQCHARQSTIEEKDLSDTSILKSAKTSPLTVRQREVLELISSGNTNKEIANLLNMSEPTVRTHLTAIFKKLGVANRTQAAQKANKMGHLLN